MQPQPIATAAVPQAAPDPSNRAAAPAAKLPRFNAVRHGLTSREFVCSPEETPAFAHQLDVLRRHYAPAGPVESTLVDSIAAGLWRLERAFAIEQGIFALTLEPPAPGADPEIEAALAPARTWLANGHSLSLLSLYESRIRRTLTADKAELAQLQKGRRAQAAESVCSAPSPARKSVCSRSVPPRLEPRPEPLGAPRIAPATGETPAKHPQPHAA